MYGKQAETFNQYMAKGRPVLIGGRLQFQSWTAKDGAKKSKLLVVVEGFQFLGQRSEEGKGTQPPAPADAPAPSDDGEIPF